MDQYGWVCLHRKLMESWIWQGDSDLLKFWVWCLLRACHAPSKATVGKTVVELQRGQLVFGRSMAAQKTGLSERKIRTCLSVLQKDKENPEITLKTTNKYSVLTIVKYDDYQIAPNTNDQQTTNQRPAGRPTNDHMQEVKKLIPPLTPQRGSGGEGGFEKSQEEKIKPIGYSTTDPDCPEAVLARKLELHWAEVLRVFPEVAECGVSPDSLSQLAVLNPARDPLLAVSHMIEAIKDPSVTGSAFGAARWRLLNGNALRNGTLGKLRRALGDGSAVSVGAVFEKRERSCTNCGAKFSYAVSAQDPQEFEQCVVCRRSAAGFDLGKALA